MGQFFPPLYEWTYKAVLTPYRPSFMATKDSSQSGQMDIG